MKWIGAFVAVALVVGGFFFSRVYGGPVPEPQVTVGGEVASQQLTALDGNVVNDASMAGENGTLLLFIATQCPYSNAYNARMEQLAKDYAEKGISVVGINSNRTEPADDVAEHASEHGLTFSIVKDPDNVVADYFGASVTPEAYLLDASRTLVYHGRLDADHDDESLGAREVRGAMDALLAGEAIEQTGKKAFGCSIKRVMG